MELKSVPYNFRILDADVAEHRSLWMDLWDSWREREVFAHPAYVRLFCRRGDRPCCATWQEDNAGVLFPFIMRPLENEPWARKIKNQYDLIGSYGYGGPYYWGGVDPGPFWARFDNWAKKNGIVTLFTRLSLFADQNLPFQGSTQTNALNIVRTLDAPLEEIWRRYEHKVRKNVNRARTEGVTIVRDDSGLKLNEFLEVYNSTMKRRNAQKSYFFPKAFFFNLAEELHGQYAFFHAVANNQIISSELVLVSQRFIYSFLGGTQAEAFALRPNDLIKHDIIQWGIESGKEAYVLGGGYSGPDGIYRFKKSFAPDGERPFFVGMRTWDNCLYMTLVELRREFEKRSGRTWVPMKGFFPAYRG